MRLTSDQIEQFNDQGFLVIPDVVSAGVLDAIRSEYREVVDRAADELYRTGKIASRYAHLDFEERYFAILNDVPAMYDFYEYLDISLPLFEHMPADARMHAGPAVFDLLTDSAVLDIVEQFVGPEIYSNPVQHARIKPPAHRLPDGPLDANVSSTYWHQDAGVVETEAVSSDILTVWVAVTDATVQNGCMYAVAGSHRRELTMHCPGKNDAAAEVYIADSLIDDANLVALDVPSGGVVLLHRLTEHGAGRNNSEHLRWSFDLRYQPVGQPTGRSYFPGFVARSQARPESALSDPATWHVSWMRARDDLVSGRTEFTLTDIWGANATHPVCA